VGKEAGCEGGAHYAFYRAGEGGERMGGERALKRGNGEGNCYGSEMG
jgi:hypothetical protein